MTTQRLRTAGHCVKRNWSFLKARRPAAPSDEVAPRLWVINMRLPDMDGLDLYVMLNDQWPDTPVYLVGDDYRPEDEINVRTQRRDVLFLQTAQWGLDRGDDR